MSGCARGYTTDFGQVHRREIAWINVRFSDAEKLSLPHEPVEPAAAAAVDAAGSAKTVRDPTMPMQGLGLAISGGGIRSAAFALGALQAIDQDLARPGQTTGGVARFHYLSTVSGGGYIGSSLRVAMQATGGDFPFASQTGDKADTRAVGHIRNYSRYLMPRGLPDLVGSFVVVLRGLAANVAIVASVLLVLAGLTGLFNPNQDAYSSGDPIQAARTFVGHTFGMLGYTKLLLLIGFVLLLAWAVVRSLQRDAGEFGGALYRATFAWLCVTVAVAFLELQPLAIKGLFAVQGPERSPASGEAARAAAGDLGPIGSLAGLAAALSPYLAPLAAIIAFFSRQLGDTLHTATSTSGLKSIATVVVARAASLLVALALPVLLWVVYLQMTLATDIGYIHRPLWLASVVSDLCGAPDISLITDKNSGVSAPLDAACRSSRLVAVMFIVSGLAVGLLTWFLKPNANSLHRLYRDRLSKAFLFDPSDMGALRPGQDPPEMGATALDAVTGDTGPLHLVNCALNVQASKVVNRRGRNADFFFFSPVFSGSSATGFCEAGAMRLPDLGAAMAISGAAASSNMGAQSLRGLAPTLALLNIRLGYWMANPRLLAPGHSPTAWDRVRNTLQLYLLTEIFSQLDECAAQIYLTDGGHIENLGLYELLRRRLKAIVVIDAEADPAMTFGSLVTLQRYARIDLGVRITLPWQPVAAATLAVDKACAGGTCVDPVEASTRPHVAVGTIEYSDGSRGCLIYVKASLTGDENDYILDYKRRFPAFPHETTGDQFFSEEQFEAYRSLGFHALHSAFQGRSAIAGLPAAKTMTAADGPPATSTLRDLILS